MSDLAPFVAHVSRPRTFLLFAGATAAALAGLWITGFIIEPPASADAGPVSRAFFGGVVAIFFGMCAIIAARRLGDPGEQLRISQRGIYWKQWSETTIPWSEIADVSTWTHKGQKSIILTLKNRDFFPSNRLLGKVSGANRALTGGDIPISMTGLDRRYREAWEAMGAFSAAQARASTVEGRAT